MSRLHDVRVAGVPAWVPATRLLGRGPWRRDDDGWRASLPTHDAADLAARLRGVALGGAPLVVSCAPPLPRPAVRAARTDDARRRRDTTPGFTRAGVRLDDVGRMSLTPEALALALGQAAAGRRVVDAGCGAGGNTIGFARAGCTVTAIERDAARLADARHNAARYGMADRVRFVLGDASDVPADADLVFVDPPWLTDGVPAAALADLPLLAHLLTRVRGELWAKVPPGFDVASVPGAQPEAWFGEADGDRQRVKFVLLRVSARPA